MGYLKIMQRTLIDKTTLSGQLTIIGGYDNVSNEYRRILVDETGKLQVDVVASIVISGPETLSGLRVVQNPAEISGQRVIINPTEISGQFVTADVTAPSNILINYAQSGNPLKLGSQSGGMCLNSGAIKSVIVKAPATNSGDVWLGGYAAGHMPVSGNGLLLTPSEAVVLDIKELGYVKALGTVSGYVYVSYLGIV